MPHYLWKSLLLSLLLLTPMYGYGDATVLIYHRFGEDRYPTTNVSVENFRQQLDYLAANHYDVVPLSTIVESIKNGHSLPDKTVAITVDDGYSSVYTTAWPLLKKYNFPFTVFVYGRAVAGKYRNFLSWDQINEMEKAGVDFQEHGYDHHRFGQRPAGADEVSYGQWILEDLKKSRDLFAGHLIRKPLYLALPYGEYNSIVLDACRKAGYEAVFSQDPGAISNDSFLWALPREPILGEEWSTLSHFQKILSRVDLPLADLVPDIQPLSVKKPAGFGARLLYPERYAKDSFGLYVSELGWQKAVLTGNRVAITNERHLERRQNRVMISAWDKKRGRQAIRFWLLIDDRRQVIE